MRVEVLWMHLSGDYPGGGENACFEVNLAAEMIQAAV